MVNVNKSKIHKFYIAADKIADAIANGNNDHWTKNTIDEAVAHGQRLLAERPHLKCVAIVEITHIITRQDLPIKVLKLKK